MISTKQAAKFLGISESALRNWRCQGVGPPFHKYTERIVRYDIADLERFKLRGRCVPVPHTTGHHAAL